MRRYADDPKRRAVRLTRGFLARCAACGLEVVHAESTNLPFHMHRWSKLCRDRAALRAQAEKTRVP